MFHFFFQKRICRKKPQETLLRPLNKTRSTLFLTSSLMSSGSISGAAAPTAHTDWQGEVVFNVGLPVVSQAWGPRYGRAHILGVTPSGTDIRGNVTVLVSGAAFHNFGARSPPPASIQA